MDEPLNLDKMVGKLMPAQCFMCEDKDPDCPQCNQPPMSGTGLVYVAMGIDSKVVVLESENDILNEQLSDAGGWEYLSIDEPDAEGIWKAVVSYWGHRDYWGDYDDGFNVEGEGWEEVESYPEPYCVVRPDPQTGDPEVGRCHGMLRARDAKGTWSCDKHAGRVA